MKLKCGSGRQECAGEGRKRGETELSWGSCEIIEGKVSVGDSEWKDRV